MSAHTTLGIGGKADLFYTTENSGDLVKAVRLCRTFKVPVTVIGEGGGVVVSDSGIRGMVIKNKSERIQIKPQKNIFDVFRKKHIKKAEVTIDSGVKIDVAIAKLQALGITGLEKYASLTGNMGALIGNGEGREGLKRVSVLDIHGGVRSMGVDKKFRENIIIDATYVLGYGVPMKWGKRTILKKAKSVAKVFEDIPEDEQKTLGYLTRNAGFIIGEILNMKGFRVGKMAISDRDQNEIVNLGGGRAEDFIALVEEIKSRVREAIGIELEEKVVRLGFEVE